MGNRLADLEHSMEETYQFDCMMFRPHNKPLSTAHITMSCIQLTKVYKPKHPALNLAMYVTRATESVTLLHPRAMWDEGA